MINSVYNYYLSTYAHKSNARYDNHTKEQLKNIFGRIIKNNSHTPTYKVDFSEDAVKYAIDLKERARELNNAADEFSDSDNGQIVYKKTAKSGNPDIITANYVGTDYPVSDSTFDVNVSQIACNQINTGNFLQPDKHAFKPGEYSFDLSVNNVTYQFEFDINDNETTRNVQDKIARLINNSDIGMKADVLTDSLGNTGITISSDATGTSSMSSVIFNVNDNENVNSAELVDTLGINRVSQYPANAVYTVNGNSFTSKVNNVIVDNAFELQFLRPTGNSSVAISLTDDGNAIAESLSELVNKYNSLVSFTSKDDNTKFEGNNKLQREFNNVAKSHRSLLNESGLNVNDNGSITLNKNSIISAADSGSMDKVFNELNSFLKDIKNKAGNITVNPMDYVNNKIIAYKNPKFTLNDPYNLSAYSGIIINQYI